jgi:hypothetical protein
MSETFLNKLDQLVVDSLNLITDSFELIPYLVYLTNRGYNYNNLNQFIEKRLIDIRNVVINNPTIEISQKQDPRILKVCFSQFDFNNRSQFNPTINNDSFTTIEKLVGNFLFQTGIDNANIQVEFIQTEIVPILSKNKISIAEYLKMIVANKLFAYKILNNFTVVPSPNDIEWLRQNSIILHLDYKTSLPTTNNIVILENTTNDIINDGVTTIGPANGVIAYFNNYKLIFKIDNLELFIGEKSVLKYTPIENGRFDGTRMLFFDGGILAKLFVTKNFMALIIKISSSITWDYIKLKEISYYLSKNMDIKTSTWTSKNDKNIFILSTETIDPQLLLNYNKIELNKESAIIDDGFYQKVFPLNGTIKLI